MVTHPPLYSPSLSDQVSGDIATQIGRGMALGFQAFATSQINLGAGSPSPSGSAEVGKTYSPNSIAALKGFCCSKLAISLLSGLHSNPQKIQMCSAATYTSGWINGRVRKVSNWIGGCSSNRSPWRTSHLSDSTRDRASRNSSQLNVDSPSSSVAPTHLKKSNGYGTARWRNSSRTRRGSLKRR